MVPVVSELDADVSPEVQAAALRVYGGVANHAGDDELAESLYRQSLAEYERMGDELGVAVVTVHLAHNAWYRGDVDGATQLARTGLDAGRRLGHAKVEAQALGVLGDLEFEKGMHEPGLADLEESAELARRVDFVWWEARMYLRLAKRYREIGRTAAARTHARDCLRLAAAMPDHRRIVQAVDALAALAADDGRLEPAGILRGAVEAETARNPLTAWSITTLPSGVSGDPGFVRQREEGLLLSLDDAVTLALALA